MGSTTFPLSIIADVTVTTATPQVAAPTFNIALVVGNSNVIPTVGSNARIRRYLQATYSTQMLNDGFSADDPEYICAQIYFSQQPPPPELIIGAQDPTALETVAVGNAAGTGYVVGDLLTVVQAGASGGVLRITTIGTGGSVTGVATQVGQQGTGYSNSTGLATTTTGAGTGATIDITAIGESPLQAFQACRMANADWYPGMVITATDSDHVAISQWVQSQLGTLYFGTTSSAAVLNAQPNSALKTIFAANSSRTWMQYATTQGNLLPNQAYFVVAVMGQAMASNTQLANSAYTEKFSGGVPLVGVFTEPLTQAQVINIEGTSTATGPNGNLYLNYANSFNVLEQGTMMAPNTFFDQILNLDVIASNIQFSIMNLLTSVPKVPQTDAGQQLLIQAVESALAISANTGFLAPGIWNGQNIIGKIVPGQTLPTGYAVVSPSYRTMSAADIQARKAPPIYVALIEAGAVHFVTVAVFVQV
jgi:hypothetical protein